MRNKTDNSSAKVSREIRRLLLNALNNKKWYFFKNSRLCKCWEEMTCANTQCPSYNSRNLRCWQVSGTFCKGTPQGEFVKKIGNCQKCTVYKKATEEDPILLIGEDFNNLMFHLKTKEEELSLNIRNSMEKNKKLTALNNEVTDLVRKLDNKNALLRELSIKDGLTGLYNYRFFREILNEQYNLAKRYSLPLSCVMIDIDYFKAVNDTYGHQWGDVILFQLADILKKNIREADRIVRYGGEEFVIILPNTDSASAYEKAEKLRKLISGSAFKIGRKTLSMTISLGIASYCCNEKINKAERLVSLADKALYQAKERGRNQTVLYCKAGIKAAGRNSFAKERLLERRKYPRIQVRMKVKGRADNNLIFDGYTSDISCSGISLLSAIPFCSATALKIKLYLPETGTTPGKVKTVDIEGTVIHCKRINGSPGGKKPVSNYMIAVSFNNISNNTLMRLQNYFISLFK